MSKIGLWNTTAANNNSSPPDGWPELQLPSTVNNCAREMMAQIRAYCQDAQWFDHGMSPTFIDATSFTVPGDQSAFLESQRNLKLYDATTLYGTISTISVSSNTKVVLTSATTITASLSSFAISIISFTNPAIQIFASGTRLGFAQAAAPLGWTQDTTDSASNRMLRFVTGAGNGVAGTHSPILNNVVTSHTHTITTGVESVNHTHNGITDNPNQQHLHAYTGTTGTESVFHTHSEWGTGNGGGSVNVNIANNLAGAPGSDTGIQTGNQSQLHTHGFSGNTGVENQEHTHTFTTSGISVDHTHSGTTDNGSSQTNWQPRYIDMILCTKN